MTTLQTGLSTSVSFCCLLMASPVVWSQVQELPIVAHIRGGTFAVEKVGNLLYTGEGSHFRVLDVANPSSPAELGRVLLDGIVRDIEVRGTFAYIAAGDEAGLRIVNIVDPENLEIVGSFDEPGSTALDLDNEFAYLAGFQGVSILNASSVTDIRKVGLVPGGSATSVAAQNSILYSGFSQSGELTVFDISDPSDPVKLSSQVVSMILEEIVVDGDRLYVAESTNIVGQTPGAFEIYDISDAPNPIKIGQAPFPDRFKGSGLTVADDVLYATGAGLQIFDVSTPSAPVKLSALETFSGEQIVVADNVAYVADEVGGLRVFDVANLTSPSQLTALDTGENFSGVAVSGNVVYVATTDALELFDVSDPFAPVSLSTFTAADPIRLVGVRGDLALVDSFHVVDISDALNPVGIGFFPPIDIGVPKSVGFAGSYAVASDDVDGVQVVDISDPSMPAPVGTYLISAIVDFVVVGKLAFSVRGGQGLEIFEIDDPANPQLVGALNFGGTPIALDVQGDYCYMIESGGSLHVIDVSDPSMPVEVALLSVVFGLSAIEVVGNTAYVAADTDGLYLLDISNPLNPVVVAIANTPGVATDVAITSFAYIADDLNGLAVVAIPPNAPQLDPLAPFLNADTVTLTGTVDVPGSFVAVGGGVEPVFEQLGEGITSFSIVVELREEARNVLSATTMNEFGLVSLPAIARVVEGLAFPSTLETVTALAITPNPAPAVALNDSLAFSCTATFSDASIADVTEFVTWEATNGELITDGGLYVNTKTGTAQVRAFVAGVFSGDIPVPGA